MVDTPSNGNQTVKKKSRASPQKPYQGIPPKREPVCLYIPMAARSIKKWVYLQQPKTSPGVYLLVLPICLRFIQESYMVFCWAQGLPAT